MSRYKTGARNLEPFDFAQGRLLPLLDSSNDSGQPLADLVDALQSVDTTTPEAGLNATSIEDNNGGRIELNEDPSDPSVIKK